MRGAILDADSLGREQVSLEPVTGLLDDWEVYGTTSPEEVGERIKQADVVLVNKVNLNGKILSQAKNLKLISVMATGTDNIDFAMVEKLGITLCNAVNYATPSVVEHTIALLLSLSTRMIDYVEDVRHGKWQQSSSFCLLDHPIVELSGKTLGIIGYGALGKGVARVAEAMGMNVVISQRPGTEVQQGGRTELRDLLPKVDFLSLHCPLNEATRRLINEDSLALMKPSAFLINTARGGLVDSEALIHALKSGKLAGAALNVLDREPPVESEILLGHDIPNLIVTPHNAWGAIESRNRLIQQMRDNILGYLDGRPRNLVC